VKQVALTIGDALGALKEGIQALRGEFKFLEHSVLVGSETKHFNDILGND
jgi:hypothetical protein